MLLNNIKLVKIYSEFVKINNYFDYYFIKLLF